MLAHMNTNVRDCTIQQQVCNTPDSDRLGDGKPGCTTDADGTKRGVLIKTFDTAGMLLP